MQCPVAGFQFHDGESCWERMKRSDPLVLRREPGNRHDSRAICVEWQGVRLGYVPREANYAVSQMMDRGARVAARISELGPRLRGGDGKVMMEVVAFPQAVVASSDPVDVGVCERHLDPCVASPRAPSLDLAKLKVPQGADQERVLRSLHECVPELARRLALPPVASLREGRRRVRLWDAVEISVAEDGCDLRIRFTQAIPGVDPPALTLDLRSPIGQHRWLEAFLQCVAETCRRHGFTRAAFDAPLAGWMRTILRRTFASYVDWDRLRRSVQEFLAPAPLAVSLTNRIFDLAPSAAEFSWVCGRTQAIALAAVEHPAMLPFLRLAHEDEEMSQALDPLAELQRGLTQRGLDPALWKKLARWTWPPFELLGEGYPSMQDVVIRYANLLHTLEAQSPPPELFTELVHDAGFDEEEDPGPDFERYPEWFMRALLRETQRVADKTQAQKLKDEMPRCLDWVLACDSSPDANQRRAGWDWIAGQAWGYERERELASRLPWPVPLPAMTFGPWRVVPITCAAELAEEAAAMKNCLEAYGEECAAGTMLVFSVRDLASGARVACFAATREDDERAGWSLVQVAGKMNSKVVPAVERIAEVVVGKLRLV